MLLLPEGAACSESVNECEAICHFDGVINLMLLVNGTRKFCHVSKFRFVSPSCLLPISQQYTKAEVSSPLYY